MNVPIQPAWFNPAQLAILQDFANGEFRYLTQCATEEAWRARLDRCGDGLLRFLLIELSRREDCLSHDEAVRRIEVAIRDLESAMAAVQSLPAWDDSGNSSTRRVS